MIGCTRKISIFSALFLLLTSTVYGGEAYPLLARASDPVLQNNLEKSISTLGLEAAAKRGNLAVALVDVTDPEHPHFAAINGDNMMYAASLPKIAILFGAFKRIEAGDMKLDKTTREQLTQMIRYSSNAAATKMLNRVGKQYLADLLQSPRYRLYDPKYNGGLWVGKAYDKQGAWKRDPLHNLSHGATAFQVARLYYLLETGQLLPPKLSLEMKEILGHPGINHKFVRGLNTYRPGSEIYRKSGSWGEYHCDSALVERDGRRYIAVALAHNRKGGEWMKRLIVAMDDLVFHKTTHQVALLK